MREIQTVSNPQGVGTIVGEAPVLPEKADVTYKDGTNGKEPIVWEEIPEESYVQAGTFIVKGTVGNYAHLPMQLPAPAVYVFPDHIHRYSCFRLRSVLFRKLL